MDNQELIETVMQLYGRADKRTKRNIFWFTLQVAGGDLANVADYCQKII